ncbi:MAG TPA: ribosome maturation factor RimM [Terriglobia bacterium]|nr:ribosome maturation factor RimM [Terriglobia bacterium]
MQRPAMVAIALIQTTHGRRGEVAADLLTDFPERFTPGLRVTVRSRRESRQLRIESAWMHKGRVILQLEGVQDLTAARALRGAVVEIPRSERMPLPPGRLYLSDLIGCAVLEDQEVIGTVAGWEETGAAPLLRVEGAQGEILIPYREEICYAVDLAAKQIQVRLPDGLRQLNAPAAAANGKRPGGPAQDG